MGPNMYKGCNQSEERLLASMHARAVKFLIAQISVELLLSLR